MCSKLLITAVVAVLSSSNTCFAHVFIGNTRKLIAPDDPHSNMVGKLFFNGKGICTASLVGANVLLAAAHCFLDNKNKFDRGSYIFRAGYENGKAKFESKLTTQIRLGTYAYQEDPANDWAVAKLELPIGNQTGWFELKNVSMGDMAWIKWRFVKIISYALDYDNGEIPVSENCLLTDYVFAPKYPQNLLYAHNCSVTKGGSGAPMFAVEIREGLPTAFIYAITVQAPKIKNGDGPIEFSDDVANHSVAVERFYQTVIDFIAPQAFRK
jgi:V8-like Glu-specific endopeptidase